MVFVVNKYAQMKTGEHTIHKIGCIRKPKSKNIKELGDFEDARVALAEATKYYACLNGCKYCCKEIHLKR